MTPLTHLPGATHDLSPADLGIERSAHLADQLANRPDGWWGHVREIAEGRWYARIADTPEANAWLILWASGSRIDLHDHGSSSATILVVRGELDEHYQTGFDGPIRQRRLHTGAPVSFGPDHIHAMANRSPGTAASLHVYSPPLHEMTRFVNGNEVIDATAAGWISATTEGDSGHDR